MLKMEDLKKYKECIDCSYYVSEKICNTCENKDKWISERIEGGK